MLADTTGIFVNDNNAADMIADYVFNNNFNTYVDIKFYKIEDNWKTYIRITVAKGRIRIRPRTKVNVISFVQWARYKMRQDEDPILTLFQLSERDDLIERLNTHKH